MGLSHDMPRPISCRLCGHKLHPQFSPLEYAASKHRMCGQCWAEFNDYEIVSAPNRKPGICEHLWAPWAEEKGYILGINPPSPAHNLYARHCTLCGTTDAFYCLEAPPHDTPELDIGWCQL